MSTGGGAETFGYDLLGRMTSIARQIGTSEKLYYDPFGALVQRQAGSALYSYVGKRGTVTGTLAAGCQTESGRVSRRLPMLRGWSHETLVARGFSGHWMVFYLVPTLFFLARPSQRARKEASPLVR